MSGAGWRWLKAALRRFSAAQAGVAAVEFALILPVMLLLYVGSVEVSTLITADRRVTTIAHTIGDLVSRRNGAISRADLDGYFDAAAAIIAPYPRDSLTQVVSLVRVSADGSASVVWSRGHNGGEARAAGESYALPAESEMSRAARNGYLLAAEARYNFSPMLGLGREGPFPLHRELFHVPRSGGMIGLT